MKTENISHPRPHLSDREKNVLHSFPRSPSKWEIPSPLPVKPDFTSKMDISNYYKSIIVDFFGISILK